MATSKTKFSRFSMVSHKTFAETQAIEIEADCHKHFAHARTRGEFFKISFDAACLYLQSLTDRYGRRWICGKAFRILIADLRNANSSAACSCVYEALVLAFLSLLPISISLSSVFSKYNLNKKILEIF